MSRQTPSFLSRLAQSLGLRLRMGVDPPQEPKTRARKDHVVVIDGTKSRFAKGEETNAGILFKLIKEAHDPNQTCLWYHPGIQGHGFWNWVTIASGWGINQVIFEAYAHLAKVYRPGDRIFFFGFFTNSVIE